MPGVAQRHDFVRVEDRGRPEPACVRRAGFSSASPSREGKRFADRYPRLRILVVDEYRSYRETIAAVIQSLHPRAEVTTAESGALAAEVARTGSHLVIFDQPDAGDVGGTMAWVQIPHAPGSPTTIYFDGRFSEAVNPTLDELLSIVAKAETLAHSRLLRGQ